MASDKPEEVEVEFEVEDPEEDYGGPGGDFFRAMLQQPMACPASAMRNAEGEGFMDVLTGIRDALLTHNKVLYKLACAVPSQQPEQPEQPEDPQQAEEAAPKPKKAAKPRAKAA